MVVLRPKVGVCVNQGWGEVYEEGLCMNSDIPCGLSLLVIKVRKCCKISPRREKKVGAIAPGPLEARGRCRFEFQGLWEVRRS